MTSYRAPLLYQHERKGSWEEQDFMPPRRDFDDDYFYDHSHSRHNDDSGHPLYDENKGYLEDERREYIDYRDGNPDLRRLDGGYRHFERENRKAILRDFRRNEESSRDVHPVETSRESRFFDSLNEYIRELQDLKHADVSREKRGPRSLLDLEPMILNDDRSRDHDGSGGYRSRDYPTEERPRDRGYRPRHDDDDIDDDYRCNDYSDDYGYRRNERRPRIKEPDYYGNDDPGRHGYPREHERNVPFYQRDGRNDHDKRSEDILYGNRDRHRRYAERELRKQIDEYDSHGRENSSEREGGRRGREFSYIDRDKHSYSSRLLQDERTTRPEMKSYSDEPLRRAERGEPRCKRERRLSKEVHQRGSRHNQRQRCGRQSKSPGIPSKVHSRSSSPTRKRPLSSGKAQTHENNQKRKMPVHDSIGTKRCKYDGRQTKTSPKSQDAPNGGLITRDQFLSRDVFNFQKHTNRDPEGKRTKSSDVEFRDSNLSRSSCGEHDLRHELSASKSLHLGDSSDYDERSSTASLTRIIDSEPSAIRSIVQIPTKNYQDLHESRTKNKEEVEIHSAQVKRSITPGPVINSRVKQVSTLPNAEPLPATIGQSARTSEVLKRKVSICSGRAPSPLLGAVEKPKVDLPADDLRLLIMSRRLRQDEETTPSLDENLTEKKEAPLLSSPRTDHQCQVSSERQGSTDRMVELSYSDPEASVNEESTPPTPPGHACRKVVMRREVILEYGSERSHPTALHRSLDKDKEKEKLGNEKESSGKSNVVVEVVSEGMANPPVCTNHPLFKEGDENLSTVEVVDRSFESLDSHAADDSQRSDESTKDVHSYRVEHCSYGNAIADAANSVDVCEEESNYSQQAEEGVSNQQILDYDSSVMGKYQETKADGVQESEYLKEEDNGAWIKSSEHYENEQHWPYEENAYQSLGRFQEENNAVRENPLEHQEKQQSLSHSEQEYSQQFRYDREASDARENPSEYYDNELHQSVSNYEQEYSQELVCDVEKNKAATENPSEAYEEEQKEHFDQQSYQELGNYTEKSDVVNRENASEHYEEEQQIPYYEQEHPQELGHDEDESDARENPTGHHEKGQPLSHYEQEYPQELGHDEDESDARENPAGYHEKEQPLSHNEQEYPQEIRHYTEESGAVREDLYEEEKHSPQYDQLSYQELGHYTEEGDVVGGDISGHYEEEEQIPHYDQECYQKIGHFGQESDAAREDPAQYYEEEQPILHYDEECPQELEHFQEKSDAFRENPSEFYEEKQSYQEFGHYANQSDDQPLPYHEQQSYRELGQESFQEVQYNPEDGFDNTRNSCSQSYQEDQPGFRYEAEFPKQVDHLPENATDEERESSSEPHNDEQGDDKQGYFQEFEQFAGTSDAANDHDSLSESSEQESESSEYEEETTSQSGDGDDSFSSEGESYQSTSEEDHLCKRNMFGVSDGSEQQYPYNVDSMSDAALTEVKPGCSSEYTPVVNSHQYKPDNAKNVEEYEYYDGDSQEDTPAMSNGYDVILALDNFNNDETDNDIKYSESSDFDNGAIFRHNGIECKIDLQGGREMTQVHGISYKLDAPSSHGDKYAVVGNPITEMQEENQVVQNNEQKNIDRGGSTHIIGTENVNHIDEYSAGDNRTATVNYDRSSCEFDKKISLEDVCHTVGQPGKDCNENKQYQGANECEIRHHDLRRLTSCNNGENEAQLQKLQHPDLNKSSGSEYDPVLPTKDYGAVNEPNSCCYNDNDDLQAPNTSADLMNKSSGPECAPASPSKNYEIVNEEDSCCHDNDELQAPNTSGDLLNKSSGSEYDPARPTKNYEIVNEEDSCCHDNDELQAPNTSGDLLNKSSGSEYDPARPTKNYEIVNEEDSCCHDNDELQAPNTSGDLLNKSSGSEYDPARPTKNYEIVNEEDGCSYDNDELQAPNTSGDLLNKSSGSECDPARPTKNYEIVNEEDSCCHDNDELQAQNTSGDLLNKSSGSECAPASPTKDYPTENDEQNRCTDGANVVQNVYHSAEILNRSSSSEYDPSLPTKEYGITNGQTRYDGDHDEVVQQSNHCTNNLNKSNGSEIINAQTRSDDDEEVMQQSSTSHSADILNSSSGSGYDLSLSTKDDCIISAQNRYDGDHNEVTQQLYHSEDILNKSSGSEYDPSLPTKDHGIISGQTRYDSGHGTLTQQSNHSGDILNKSSSSEYDPCLPTKDYVQSPQVSRASDDVQELRHIDLKESSCSEIDPHIQIKDCDVTNDQDYYNDDGVIQDLCHTDLNKNSDSEVDNHMPMRGYDVTLAKNNHSDDNVIRYFRSPDINNNCGSETDVPMPTKDCDVMNEQERYDENAAQEIRRPDLVYKSNECIASENDLQLRDSDNVSDIKKVMEDAGSTSTISGKEECKISGQKPPESDEMQVEYKASETQECIIVMCNNETSSGNAQPSYEMDSISDVKKIMEDDGSTGTISGKEVSDEMQVEYKASDTQECIIIMCDNDISSGNAQPFFEMVLQEENRVLGVAKEVFLPLDVDANHICIYECADFQLQRVLCQTSITGDQGSNHELQADVNGCQQDLATANTTSARGQRATNSSMAAPIFREECAIQERRVQNQGNLICSPLSDDDQACSQEESPCTCLNVMQAATSQAQVRQENKTKQSVPGCELKGVVEQGDPVDEENPEGIVEITLVQNNVGISDKSCSTSTSISLTESSTENDEKETTQDTESEITRICQGLFERMAVRTRSSAPVELCRESESFRSALVENTHKNSGIADIEIKFEPADEPDLMYIDEVQYFEGEQPVGKGEITGTPESCDRSISSGEYTVADDSCSEGCCDSSGDAARGNTLYSTDASFSEDDGNVGKSSEISDTKKSVCSVGDQQTKTVPDGRICIKTSDVSDDTVNEAHDKNFLSLQDFESISSDVSDSVGVSSPRLGVKYCKKKPPQERQTEMMLKLREEFRRCSEGQGCDLVSSSSETSYSALFDSHDSVLQAQPYDPECASLTQVSLSDVSIETPFTSSAHALCVTGQQDSLSNHVAQTSSISSQASYMTLKTQTATSTLRASLDLPSPCDLKSQKPYDPENCHMDVDTFSELSGMSLDTPSSSTVEYTVTEADTTLVGAVDDDSEPYTPEVYSRSPENGSEPYTPEAHSPVLSLSGDESDPELFSCKYTNDSSAPYNPESHCPVDLNISSISGNEADNEVSTGVSSPEFSFNRKIPLSLRLKKKPGAKIQSYVGYCNLDKDSSNDDAGQKIPEAYSPESFVPNSKPPASRKGSHRKSVHSRSKSDAVECRKRVNTTTNKCGVEIKKPPASQKSLASSREKSVLTLEKERKSRKEDTTGSKRKPLKSLVTLITPCTNKKAKEDGVRTENMDHRTSANTRMRKKFGTRDHNSKSISKEKESVKRRAVSETNKEKTAQDKSTPPLKKTKLSSRSSEKKNSPTSSGTGTSHQSKNKPSTRRNSREEKFKKPVNPARCKTEKGKSRERTKEPNQKKSAQNGSAVKRKVQGRESAAKSSATVLHELKSIMKDIHRKSAKSSKKSHESSAGTKNIAKTKETVDEHHLLDEGHELLELALEESINKSKSDKAIRALTTDNDIESEEPGNHEKKVSLNLAEKVDEMKRKLAEAQGMPGNETTNLTKRLKTSEQGARVDITISNDFDHSADDKGKKNVVKAKNEEFLDTLKANQTSAVRSTDDKSESFKLAVKCSGDGKDAINSYMTESEIIDKDLGMENAAGVAPHETENKEKYVQPDDDFGRLPMVDNGMSMDGKVVSSVIEKKEDSRTEMPSETDVEPRPTGVQETINEPVEVNTVCSGNETPKNKQIVQSSDEKNRFSNRSDNLDTNRAVPSGESFLVDKVGSVVGNLKGNKDLECMDVVTEFLSNETARESFDVGAIESIINKEKNREKEKNICKEDVQETPAEDNCMSDQEVTNTLSARFSVISSSTMKTQGQEISRHEVRRLDSEMSGGQLLEDKTGKTVISDSGGGEVELIKMSGENDRLLNVQDEQLNKGRQSNENNEFDHDKDDWSKDEQPNEETKGNENNKFHQEKDDWSKDKQPNEETQGNENNEFDHGKGDWQKDIEANKEKQGDEKLDFDQEKNDLSPIKENAKSTSDTATTASGKASTTKVHTRANGPPTPNGLPFTQMVQTAANNSATASGKSSTPKAVHAKANGPPTPSVLRCTQMVQTAANDSATASGKASTPKAVHKRANGPPTPSVLRCTQMVQTAANDSATASGKASTPKAVHKRANGPPTPRVLQCTQMVQTAGSDSATASGKASTTRAVDTRANGPPTPSVLQCTQMVQTAANDSATASGKASTPKAVHKRANGPPTPSVLQCTQMVQTAGNDSATPFGKVRTPKDRTANKSDTENSKSKEGDGECSEAESILAGPSKDPLKKNQKHEQACNMSKAEERKASDVAVNCKQLKEEAKDVKSEISLEKYIEAQLKHGLSLPDISVNGGLPSKVSSENLPSLPSLPSLSFTDPSAAAPDTSKSRSLSPLNQSSSDLESQKKHLSPAVSSNVERDACLINDVSKEKPLANESKCQVPSEKEGCSKQEVSGMDIVRSLRAEYEKKILAILQKRVDVEKAYREECTSIVNAVKALARKKKNMERELQEVLQSSLREISQKYISELQRFVRNETI